MRKIAFTKMVASGNDFIVVADRLPMKNLGQLARRWCDRKAAIGADGLLVLSRVKNADCQMRIFNADGSEAEMCGNGARCTALWLTRYGKCKKPQLHIQTLAGSVLARVADDSVRVRLTQPQHLELDIPLVIAQRKISVHHINTGVPHTVIFVEALENIDVPRLGRIIRFDKRFSPAGTNVDFVEVINRSTIAVRTYERGVEDETLACGTGVVASALITASRFTLPEAGKMQVLTQGGEKLRVYFKRTFGRLEDVWLEGKVAVAYEGVCHV